MSSTGRTDGRTDGRTHTHTHTQTLFCYFFRDKLSLLRSSDRPSNHNFRRLTKPNCTPFATAPRLIGIENHLIDDKDAAWSRLQDCSAEVFRSSNTGRVIAISATMPTTKPTLLLLPRGCCCCCCFAISYAGDGGTESGVRLFCYGVRSGKVGVRQKRGNFTPLVHFTLTLAQIGDTW